MYGDMDEWIEIRRNPLVQGVLKRQALGQTGILVPIKLTSPASDNTLETKEADGIRTRDHRIGTPRCQP